MTRQEIYQALHETVNQVHPVDSIDSDDCIFSSKYGFSPTDIVYILLICQKKIPYQIDDELIDSMENASFTQLCSLIENRLVVEAAANSSGIYG